MFAMGFLFEGKQLFIKYGGKKMKALLIGMMAVTFVLGMGFLSLIFMFGSMIWGEA